jgi:hypothetical protein
VRAFAIAGMRALAVVLTGGGAGPSPRSFGETASIRRLAPAVVDTKRLSAGPPTLMAAAFPSAQVGMFAAAYEKPTASTWRPATA